MAVSNVKAQFPCEVQKIWDIVTSLENYAWRSDIERIECVEERQFVEYTKDGYATTFTVTKQIPCERWEFDMENENMKGHWVGIFSQKEGYTEIDFTEDVTAKRMVLRPFVNAYLKRQQAHYVEDLRKAVDALRINFKETP